MDNQSMNQYQPDYVSPPGDTLAEILEDRGMTQAELAERTGRPKKMINELIQGKVALTPETAIQLELVLNIPASFWLNREQHYREFLARQSSDQVLATQVAWLDDVPVKAMIKVGWMDDQADQVKLLRETLSFYGIASPTQYTLATAVRFRRTQAFQSDIEAVTAWLRQGERLAQTFECAAYDELLFRSVLEEARSFTRQSFLAIQQALPALCTQAGVAVVIIPELPKTCVCGATRWLTPTKALIQLSLRYRTDDQFWFTFFHEAGHILLHGKRDLFLDEEHHIEDIYEQEANNFAMNRLIPSHLLEQFYSQQKANDISKESVIQFAEKLGIAPGIIVGRLQFEGKLLKSHLNELKVAFQF